MSVGVLCVCIFNATAIGQINEGSKYFIRSHIADLFIVGSFIQTWIHEHFLLHFLSYNSVICFD